MKIFIPGNVPSLKNSRIATSRGNFFSKTVRKYLQSLGIRNYSIRNRSVENYKTRPNLFEKAVRPMKEYLATTKPPYLIGFHFVRGTHHKFDWMNAAAIVADLLVAHRVIADDDMDNLVPLPFQVAGEWYSYSKENPGVLILIYAPI